jgi:O-antigen/teichoic acid export membrane protein
MLISAQLAAQAVNTIVSIITSRILGPDRRGVIDTVTSYGVIPAIIGEAGLTRATIQQIARSSPEDTPALLGHMAATRLATNLIYLLVTWGSLLLPFNDKLSHQEKWFILLWSISLVFQSFRRNGEAAFQSTEKLRYHSILVVANRILAAALVMGAIYLKPEWVAAPQGTSGWYLIIGMVLTAYVLVDVLDAIAAWIIMRGRIARPSFNLDVAPKLALLKYGWPFALTTLASQLYYYIDVPLLRYLYPGSPTDPIPVCWY